MRSRAAPPHSPPKDISSTPLPGVNYVLTFNFVIDVLMAAQRNSDASKKN